MVQVTVGMSLRNLQRTDYAVVHWGQKRKAAGTEENDVGNVIGAPVVDVFALPDIAFTAAATSSSSLQPMPDATVDTVIPDAAVAPTGQFGPTAEDLGKDL